ncbi:MAG: dithiol-disulfide isomerase [Bacillales bacterium]|nr:dithiol-disulfide isomerase [Bacillales bacterium]
MGTNSSINKYSINRQRFRKYYKPIELYVFIDPMCPECWAIEPILKKLIIEYGQYITLKYVLTGSLDKFNISKNNSPKIIAENWERTASRSGMSCDGNLWISDPIKLPLIVSLAIKAAELQGKYAGINFLRIIREHMFVNSKNVTREETLVKIAQEVKLDIKEFVKDIHSDTAAKSLQCDFKITKDYGVTSSPTLIFFNDILEEEGIKISGIHDYKLYIKVLEELLKQTPKKSEPPCLEAFVKRYKFVATQEIAVVYNLTLCEAEKMLRQLQLRQYVKEVPAKYGKFWKYVGSRYYLEANNIKHFQQLFHRSR